MTSKEQRQKCYKSRDSYFTCLNKHKIISSNKPSIEELLIHQNPFKAQNPNEKKKIEFANKDPLPKECEDLFKEFKENCLSSWVEYFEKVREKDAVVEYYQNKQM